MPTHLEHRRGRWHYYYRLTVHHRGLRRQVVVRCLSDHPESEERSQLAVLLHREEIRQQLIDEIDRELDVDLEAEQPSFRTLADGWLQSARSRGLNLSATEYMVRILQEEMPAGPAAEITPAHVEAVRDRLRVERSLGPRAANHYMTIAHGIFQRAIEYGQLVAQDGRALLNPASVVPRLRQAKRRPKRLTLRQVGALLEALEAYERMDDYRKARTGRVPMRGLVLASLNSGCRPGTVMRLRWEWWQRSEDLVVVPAEEMKADADHAIIVWPALREYLAARSLEHGRPAAGWIFPSPRKPGEPIRDIRHQWRRLVGLANRQLAKDDVSEAELIPPDIQFRHLRHTVASSLLGSGVPLSAVADTLGNTEEVARRHYADLDVEARRRLVRQTLEADPELGAVLGLHLGLHSAAETGESAADRR